MTNEKSDKVGKGKKKDKDVMSKREKRTIAVKLDDKEIAKLAKEYAGTKQKIALAEGEMKAAADKFKGDIKLLEGAAAEVLGYISTGERERELEVDVIYDWRSNEVRVVRVDTKEEVAKRAMSYEERQREMFGVDHKKDRGEVKDVKKASDSKAERKQPVANDVVDVETLAGWKRGKVLPSSGSVLDVECSDGKVEHAPVEGQTWRWPDEVGSESAPANNLPKVGDRIQAKGFDGWQEGKVSKIAGGLMTVDIGEDEVIDQLAINGDDWRWPETLKASVGEQAKAKNEKKTGKRGGKKRWPGDDNSEDLGF